MGRGKWHQAEGHIPSCYAPNQSKLSNGSTSHQHLLQDFLLHKSCEEHMKEVCPTKVTSKGFSSRCHLKSTAKYMGTCYLTHNSLGKFSWRFCVPIWVWTHPWEFIPAKLVRLRLVMGSRNTCQVRACLSPLFFISSLSQGTLWKSKYFNLSLSCYTDLVPQSFRVPSPLLSSLMCIGLQLEK